MAKALVDNSYINGKTYGSPENTIKINISHILETTPTHATDYDGKKGFAVQNSDTSNTSTVGQNVKK